MTSSFSVYLRVRYAECDAQQVVFNSRYAEYADLAATEFMREAVGGYQSLIEQGMDNQVVSMTINWQRAARFDDVLVCRVDVAKIGSTSFTLNMALSDYSNNALIAHIQITYVLVDAEKFTKLPISDDLREKLTNGAKGQHVNLAGINISGQLNKS